MPYEDDPAYVYSDPVVWHSGTIYRVEAPAGTWNHVQDVNSNVALIPNVGSSHGNAELSEPIGGDWPGPAGTACCWSKTVVGMDLNAFWSGSCPAADGPGGTGSADGSLWDTHTGSDGFGLQNVNTSCGIVGYVWRPWLLKFWDNPWMDDDDLEDEYNNAIATSWPGPGWVLENDYYYPLYASVEFAPDEEYEIPATRTEGVVWYYDPTGWGMVALDEDFNPVWDGRGIDAVGSVLATYSGGSAGWQSFPDSSWEPMQVAEETFFDGGWVIPEDENASAIPLTVAADSIWNGGTYPGDDEVGGRSFQGLVFRVGWTAPTFRWKRLRFGVIRQYPRDDEQGWGSGTRLYPPTKANRVIGNIQ